jgi:hypothetical protein
MTTFAIGSLIRARPLPLPSHLPTTHRPGKAWRLDRLMLRACDRAGRWTVGRQVPPVVVGPPTEQIAVFSVATLAWTVAACGFASSTIACTA